MRAWTLRDCVARQKRKTASFRMMEILLSCNDTYIEDYIILSILELSSAGTCPSTVRRPLVAAMKIDGACLGPTVVLKVTDMLF
jgi:hypothetical protein